MFRQRLLTRMQTEGVQGATGKPPGCPTKDLNQEAIPKTKQSPKPVRAWGDGSRVEDPCGVQGRRPCRGVGRSPTKGVQGQGPRPGCRGGAPAGVWGLCPHPGVKGTESPWRETQSPCRAPAAAAAPRAAPRGTPSWRQSTPAGRKAGPFHHIRSAAQRENPHRPLP